MRNASSSPSIVLYGGVIKKIAIILLQLLVTAGGIWYVFHDPRKRAQIAEALRQAQAAWLMLGWFLYGAVEGLATLRWRRLLQIQGIAISWLRAFGIVIIGLFFNLLLPGLIGGDAVRIYFIFRHSPGRKTGATFSVVMDRLLGLMSVLLLAGLSLLFRFEWFSRSGAALHIVYLALALLALGFAIAVALILMATFREVPEWMPFRKATIEAAKALKVYRSHPGSMMTAFSLSLGAHLAYYCSFYCAAISLTWSSPHSPSLLDMISIMPVVNTITSVPVSLGGTGLREVLFQELLGNLAHVPPALAAFGASLGVGIQATWGLIGAAAYLLYRNVARGHSL